VNSIIVQAVLAVLLLPWVLAVLVLLVSSRLRRDRGKRWQDFVTALGLTVVIYLNTRLSLWLAKYVPHTIDARLWRMNEALRVDPLTMIYYMEAHPALWDLMEVIYFSLPIVMAVAWIVEQNFVLRRAVAIAAVGGWILSATFPAVGPHWYLDGYTVSMRHCIPSIEWTWALLLALNARSRLRLPLWIYSGLLAPAAILLGEHYLIDLAVALPYALAVQWLALQSPSLMARFRQKSASPAAGEAIRS
jgi:PAP2 superfamily protein